jgi:hypothetical protein
MRKILSVFVFLCWVSTAGAQSYPTCSASSGPQQGQTTNCTIPILIGAASTPIVAAFSARQYLFIQNQGYVTTTINNNAICCALGSNAVATWSVSVPCNGIVIQPGGTWEPPQMVSPQTAFRVPSSDIACIAPFGNVEATIIQE